MGKIGNFNLDFPGAIIYCDSFEKKNAILDFLNKRKESIDIDIQFHDVDEAIQRALYNTTYDHEGKHLHDHLLCPMLYHNYALKLSSLYYAILTAHSWELSHKPYKYLPLPFTKWIELSDIERFNFVTRKGIDLDDVPYLSLHDAFQINRGEKECNDYFIKSLYCGALHYSEYWLNSIHNSPDTYNTEFSVRSFTESMAFVQQLTEIALRYGDEGEIICQSIIDTSFKMFQELGRRKREENIDLTYRDYYGYSLYTAAFTSIWRYAKQSKIDSTYIYPFIAYILFWALSPNEMFDIKESIFPRLRIEKLFNLDRVGIDLFLNHQDKLFNLFNDPINTFHEWDLLIGEKYIGTGIRIKSFSDSMCLDIPSTPIDYERTYNLLIRKLFDMVNHLQTLGFMEVANYMNNIVDAMYRMSSGFCRYPTTYLYPEFYSKHANDFVNVPFRIEFENVDPIKPDECCIKREGISIIDEYIYGDTLRAQNGKENNIIDWRNYVNAEKYILFSGALYGNSNINMPGRLVKEFLPGIKPWFFETT